MEYALQLTSLKQYVAKKLNTFLPLIKHKFICIHCIHCIHCTLGFDNDNNLPFERFLKIVLELIYIP